jgi:uncharacterized membrane protein YeiB
MMMSRHLTGFNRKSSLLFLLGFILLGHASDMWGEDILTVYRQAVASSPVVARARASLQADTA